MYDYRCACNIVCIKCVYILEHLNYTKISKMFFFISKIFFKY